MHIPWFSARRSSENGTFLFLLPNTLVRLDLSGQGKNKDVKLWQCDRLPDHDWPQLIELAYNLNPPFQKDVWVLDPNLWTQTISVAKSTVDGLNDEHLAQALGFEVEPYSGLAALDSLVAFQELNEDQGDVFYWVTQVPTKHFETMQECMKKFDCNLAGLSHPGGVPLPVNTPEEQGPWARLEVWPQAVICLHQQENMPCDFHILNTDPAIDGWQNSASSWFEHKGVTEHNEVFNSLVCSQSFRPDFKMVDWEQPEVLENWMLLQAQHLLGNKADRRVVHPAAVPMPMLHKVALFCLFEVFLLGLSQGHVKWLESDLAELKEQHMSMRDPSRLRQEIQSSKQDLRQMQAQRSRWHDILALVAFECPEHLFIDQIMSEPHQLTIEGYCLWPELANVLAGRLANHMSRWGFTVETPQKRGLNNDKNGGPWFYQIHLSTGMPKPRQSGNRSFGDIIRSRLQTGNR